MSLTAGPDVLKGVKTSFTCRASNPGLSIPWPSHYAECATPARGPPSFTRKLAGTCFHLHN